MRTCYCCGSRDTARWGGFEQWFLNHDKDNNVLCSRCYHKYIHKFIKDYPFLRTRTVSKTKEESRMRRNQRQKRYHHSEKGRQTALRYYNSEKRKKRLKELYQSEKYRAVKRELFQRYRRKLVELLGGRCKICGLDDIQLLQVDHINSDGCFDKLFLSTFKIYKKYIEDEERDKKVQLLCASCNWKKRYVHHEFRNRKLEKL